MSSAAYDLGRFLRMVRDEPEMVTDVMCNAAIAACKRLSIDAPKLDPEVAAALERARVVGVLDGWQSTVPGRLWLMSPSGACELMVAGVVVGRFHRGGSNDAARAKAAQAIEAGEV